MTLDPTATHLPILAGLLSRGDIRSVLEFGCGLFSTQAFIDAGCEVTSIEMQNRSWYDKVRGALPTVDLRLALGPFEWEDLDLAPRYDLIFVDGHRDSRPDCLMWAKDHTDLIVAHDTEHPAYDWGRADMSGFVVTEHKELSPWTTVWQRGSGWAELDGVGQWQKSA